MGLNRIAGGSLNQPQLVDRYQQAQAQGPRRAEQAGAIAAGAGPDQPGLRADQADISAQAHQKLAMRGLLAAGRQAVQAEPEVRADRVAAVRERLAAGFYESATIREEVAGRLAPILLQQDIV